VEINRQARIRRRSAMRAARKKAAERTAGRARLRKLAAEHGKTVFACLYFGAWACGFLAYGIATDPTPWTDPAVLFAYPAAGFIAGLCTLAAFVVLTWLCPPAGGALLVMLLAPLRAIFRLAKVLRRDSA
jgi:hypothetical protein